MINIIEFLFALVLILLLVVAIKNGGWLLNHQNKHFYYSIKFNLIIIILL